VKNPFAKALKKHSGRDPTELEQIALGTPRGESMSDEHKGFLATVLRLIDEGKIDTKEPMSFINDGVYRGLPDDLRAQTDRAIPNISSLLDHIMDLHVRPEDDQSFEMKNLIETLWQAKQRIEEKADVFIF
jgi:hypothetical protein